MDYYIIYHYHRFGHDTYLAFSDHEPSVEEVIEAFSIDFEEDEDDNEWISIDRAYPMTIKS